MSMNMQNALFAFVAVAALALLVQTIGVIVVLVIARKAAKNLRDEMEHYHAALSPILQRTREAVDRVAPKVESAAEELAVISARLREQTAEIHSATQDIIASTQRQAGRVDNMLTTVFDRVERAGTFIANSVAKPMHQLSAIVATVKSAVEHLRDSAPSSRSAQRPPRYTEADPSPQQPTGGFRG